jgi:hypothetical protein
MTLPCKINFLVFYGIAMSSISFNKIHYSIWHTKVRTPDVILPAGLECLSHAPENGIGSSFSKTVKAIKPAL